MGTQNRSVKASARWRLPVAALGLLGATSSALVGCPNQELAPLSPCTVSGVSIEVPQTGVDKVDLLFMIDDSGSMAEEQKKLVPVLTQMVNVLTTGNRDGMAKPAGMRSDFPPVKSMHIGVISMDLGVNNAPPIESCGNASYNPLAPDPANPTMSVRSMAPNGERLMKPFGDNGQLLTSTAVAVNGIWSRPASASFSVPVTLFVDPDPTCASVTFTQPWINFDAGMTDATRVAHDFSCIAKLGKNGCGLEQQLESVYKAVAPSSVVFSRNTRGQGTAPGTNAGFLRDDAILAVVLVSDEEDCSIPDESSELFNRNSTAFNDDINVRCGKAENQKYLYPPDRYIQGLRKLKSDAYQDRIIFAAIVGIPMAVNLGGEAAHSGKDVLGQILARQDMTFVPRLISGSATLEEPTPVCTSPNGDGTAAPGRRYVQVAADFNENGVVASICENDYTAALNTVVTKIAAQLSGACLPRTLRPVNGKVECDVVEIKAATDTGGCDPNKGRSPLPARRVNGTLRPVCHVDQVAVLNNQIQAGAGWYYDDFSMAVKQDCMTNPQRIAFTAGAETSAGSQARFECFQPVAPGVDQNDLGRAAVNMACGTNDGLCAQRSDSEYTLICVAGGCEIQCETDANCPASWLCVNEGASSSRRYCVNPTCPPAQSSGE